MPKYLNEEDEKKYLKAVENDKDWFSRLSMSVEKEDITIDVNQPAKEVAKKIIKIKKSGLKRGLSRKRINIVNEDEIFEKFGDNKEFMNALLNSKQYFYGFVAAIGPTLGKDIDFIKKSLLTYKDKFYYLRKDCHTEELIDWLLDNQYSCVSGVDEKFKTDERVMKEVSFNKKAIMCLSEKLRDNPDFMRPYIKEDSMIINFVSPRLLKDKDFILSFNNLSSLMYIDQSLFSDDDFVKKLIENNENVFSSLPEDIQNQYAYKFVDNKPYTIFYNLTDGMIEDTELMLKLVSKIEGDDFVNCSMTSYAMNQILENKDFNKYMVKHGLRKPGSTLSFLGESTLFQVAAYVREEIYKRESASTKAKAKIKKF